MATVNRHSLTEEFDTLKVRFPVQLRALRQHPHPRARQGAHRRALRTLWRRPRRHRPPRARTAHPHRHRLREGGASRRCTGQALSPLLHRDPGSLSRHDARPAPVRQRPQGLSKVKQKVSGCFRTRRYADAYCRISSYLQSMANRGYNLLVAIRIALAGRAVDNVGE